MQKQNQKSERNKIVNALSYLSIASLFLKAHMPKWLIEKHAEHVSNDHSKIFLIILYA